MQKRLWEREYEEERIPSSSKEEISHSVEYFVEFLEERSVPLDGRLLDVGCGNGRNLIWFAEQGMETYGMDIAENALERCREKVGEHDLTHKVTLYNQSMTEQFPFEEGYFDIVISTTTIENLLTDENFQSYHENVKRVLKSDGHLLLYYHPPQDGFYQQFVENREGKSILEMPESGIKQRLYTREEIEQGFGEYFRILDSQEFEFEDEHSGELYDRQLIATVLKRK